MRIRLCGIVAALALVCLMAGSIQAQTFQFETFPKDRPQIGCRFLHPYFDLSGIDPTTFSGVYELYTNIPVSRRINIVGSIPFVKMNYETSWYEYDEAGVGNIHVGVQYNPAMAESRSSNVALGVYIPTASEDTVPYALEYSLLGMITDNHSFFKYFPDMLTLHGNIVRHSVNPRGMLLGTEMGAYVLIPTEGSGDTELFARYGLTGGFQHGDFAIFAELLGMAIISEGDMDFGDRFEHEVTVGAQWRQGPGIFYKVYLDDENREVVKGVLGLKLERVL